MSSTTTARPLRKRAGRYHHGDLGRALLQEAVRVIQAHGVEMLTLRAVGQRLGVSRTALYRHFSDKAALLAAVGREGFRTLRLELLQAWGTGGLAEFQAMGSAYVRFAVDHPSHYRVMFGGFVKGEPDPAFAEEAAGAFQALVDGIRFLQGTDDMREDDPVQLARYIWAVVHGIATLAIDGQIDHQGASVDELTRFALDRLLTGTAP